jgi:hypothetical protein
MKKATTTGTIENGVLKLHNRKFFDTQIKSIKNGRVMVTVEKVYNKRSNPQNSYYWGVVIPICCKGLIDLGHDVNQDETHEILKGMFNKKDFVNQKTGEVTEYGGSTTEMFTIDMMEYLERIGQFASEYLGCFIPQPDQDYKLK